MNKNLITQLLFGIIIFIAIHSCSKSADVSYKQENYTVDDSLVNINVSYKKFYSENKKLNSWLGDISDSIKKLFLTAADSLKVSSSEDRKFLREDFLLPVPIKILLFAI